MYCSEPVMSDFLETSPLPWYAGDKHAVLYDADHEPIAEFGEGGKGFLDLNNRNRTALCVNALMGINDPSGFTWVARHVAKGDLPPAVLKSLLDDAKDFEVRGPGPEGEVPTPNAGLQIYKDRNFEDARYLVYLASGIQGVEIYHSPTGTLIPFD